MFLVTHAAVGAIVGEAAGGPLWAIIGGLVSHFLIDMIPHGDSHLYKNFKNRASGGKARRAKAYVTVDAISAVLFVALLFSFRDFLHPTRVSLGIVFGVLPDLLIGLYETGHASWLRRFNGFHFFCHNLIGRRRGDLPFRYGFLMQLLILILLQIRVF